MKGVRSIASILVALTLAALPLSVYSDEEDVSVKDDFWITLTAMMPPPPPIPQQVLQPADYAVKGKWSDLVVWPHVPVSAAVLPNGKILTFASNEKRTFPTGPEFTHASVFDPETSQFTTVNRNGHDMFCGAMVMLEDGRVMVPGGRNTVKTTSTFDFSTNQWSEIDDMVGTRWYPTATLMGNGNVAVASGSGTGKNHVERWNPSGGWNRLTGVDWSGIANATGFESNWWPYNFLAPNGKIFHAGPTEAMHWLDMAGNGTLTAAGVNVPGAEYPKHGSSVMYDEGKLLIAGGAKSTSGGASTIGYTVDLNGPTPVTALTPTMSYGRRFSNAVPLPNGEVMVIGGNYSGLKFSDQQSIMTPEVWNPTSNSWRKMADIAVPRNYHSVALVVPDGRIFSAGGGLSGNSADHLDAQFFTPPNLFNADGSLATRPEISSTPAAAGYGVTMTIGATPNLAGFSLIRMAATTHGLATDCRFLPVTSFTETAAGVYEITSHPNPNVLTPGYWMLFALDQNGVHSESAIIQFSASAPPPAIPDIQLSANTTTIGVMGNQIELSMTATGGISPQFTWDFGDGTALVTSNSPTAAHTFSGPGRYEITVTAVNADGSGQVTETFTQIVHAELTPEKPRHSSTLLILDDCIWNVNPDNETVTVFDTNSFLKLGEIAVGFEPSCIAEVGANEVWVSNKRGHTISVIDRQSLTVSATIPLPRGARPRGVVADSSGGKAYVALEAIGKLIRFDTATRQVDGTLDLGQHIRHLSISGDDATLLVSRFVTAPLPMESTANPLTQLGSVKFGGEVINVDVATFTKISTIILAHSDLPDASDEGRGIPNYLGAAVISPDGSSAWLPSKQDNIKRGFLRDGNDLTHDTMVRSIASRIDMGSKLETHNDRIDFDNAGTATTATFGPFGAHVFVTLEGSRKVAVLDAYSSSELFRFDVGFAPAGVAVSEGGNRLFVHNFLDRTISVFNCESLIHEGQNEVNPIMTLSTVSAETLPPQVLAGKKIFYDSRDNRMALQEYMTCASCHEDGDQDGRVWDFTGFGEGLRNTISLRGRAGTGHGPVHWSANFDEIHDFEGVIRNQFSGLGFLSDSNFSATSDPLGAPKAGLSLGMDALVAYVESLAEFDESPYRPSDAALSAEGEIGRQLFASKKCAECHGGENFTDSAAGVVHDVGTIKPSSGTVLDQPLTALDTPTLRDVWITAPYLHDGSAVTLEDAIGAHTAITDPI